MGSVAAQLRQRQWKRDSYLISTDPSLIPMDQLMAAFDSDDFYWTDSLPEEAMREMVEQSLCFGLYRVDGQAASDAGASAEAGAEAGAGAGTPGPESRAQLHVPSPNTKLKLLGFARCVTDFITFLYLTDVWVDHDHQGGGLGSWLIRSVQEVVEDMPHLRRSLLFTGDWDRSVPFYERLMHMQLIDCRRESGGLAIMERKGRGHPGFGREGTGYN
ncbi:hypothetical protein SODALDRAFT_380785 [Sodiomyces alkalinus F11]|uniref:N-acetyltransferase domain-containing protein n=1 Tax=Sodiomyces alkalinus (strain CBS 110278 / VKM F-3762 / F11) TaxID=1314773 RepID=A0A3N2PPP6_SODAK|nr:hypothetical protein SODALDRAFT_380785 [Sodiomyces alkalinus F11]ROT36475.1 hypothetical protein SODALDRAFT_380785 [Sodiomyces alkalinus F11]